MDGVRSWTGICAWESDWRREDPVLVLLVCLGLDLGHSAQQCLWGKVSHVSLFVRGRREAQSFPSYPYQVYEVSNFNAISYLHSKWWEHVSLRDSLEPWVRWLHAGSMYPAQRPALGRGGSWGCSRSNANLACYQVTLWWTTWFFSAEKSLLFHKAIEAQPAKTISH